MYRIIILLAFAAMLTGCFEERIELDNNTNENKKLVITGWINTLDQPQYIEVSWTTNYLGEREEDYVAGASVTITDAITTYELEEKTIGRYYLPDNWIPRVGDTYQLKVVHDGKEYTANEKMRPCPEIRDLFYEKAEPEEVETDTMLDHYKIIYHIQDSPEEGDGYLFTAFPKTGNTVLDNFRFSGFENDDFVNGELLPIVHGYYVVGDTIAVRLHAVSHETVGYYEDIDKEVFRGDIFDAPPANVRTNITGGAVGYFMVSDARIQDVIIE